MDVAIIKDALKAAGIRARWAPSCMQLGDCLTKASSDSCDTLRASLKRGTYQLHSEEMAMKMRSEEKERRKALGQENKIRSEEKTPAKGRGASSKGSSK